MCEGSPRQGRSRNRPQEKGLLRGAVSKRGEIGVRETTATVPEHPLEASGAQLSVARSARIKIARADLVDVVRIGAKRTTARGSARRTTTSGDPGGVVRILGGGRGARSGLVATK